MREFIIKFTTPYNEITEREFKAKCFKALGGYNSKQYPYDAFLYAINHRILIFNCWVSEEGRTVKQYIVTK